MRYFLTGGAGFIGSNFARHLVDSVPEVSKITIYDKFTYAGSTRNLQDFESDPRISVITGDICDTHLLQKSILEHDYVINFAAESHVDRSIIDPSCFIQTNLVGTYNVLEAARLGGIKVVVQISTDEVYGSISKGSSNEGDSLEPNSPYSASKAGADLLCRSYFMTYGLDVRITRSCNNYGNHQFPEKVIPVFIKAILDKKDLPVYGTGENIREWIHVTDHCKGIQTVLENGVGGEIYNIGSGIHHTNIDLANRLIVLSGSISSKIVFKEDRKGHDFRYAVNSEKVMKLGYRPVVDFQLGIEQTFKWYSENQDWWS
jgi:dTDP-glucose 4,6-dehydratase